MRKFIGNTELKKEDAKSAPPRLLRARDLGKNGNEWQLDMFERAMNNETTFVIQDKFAEYNEMLAEMGQEL